MSDWLVFNELAAAAVEPVAVASLCALGVITPGALDVLGDERQAATKEFLAGVFGELGLHVEANHLAGFRGTVAAVAAPAVAATYFCRFHLGGVPRLAALGGECNGRRHGADAAGSAAAASGRCAAVLADALASQPRAGGRPGGEVTGGGSEAQVVD